MTIPDRVRRTQQLLIAGVIVSALAWGGAVSLALLATGAFAASFPRIPQFVATSALPLAFVAGIGVAFFILWRGRQALSATRVALWIEERLPRLNYAVVTAIEPGISANVPALESVAAREDIGGVT